jgi:hypothetical protein
MEVPADGIIAVVLLRGRRGRGEGREGQGQIVWSPGLVFVLRDRAS